MAGGWEWVIILVIVVLLFGAKKLPELAGSVGKSIKEFRKAADEPGEDEGRGTDAAAADTASDDREA